MMQLSALWQTPSPFTEASDSEISLFNKHVGSQSWWDALAQQGGQVEPKTFFARWGTDTQKFKSRVKPYLLY